MHKMIFNTTGSHPLRVTAGSLLLATTATAHAIEITGTADSVNTLLGADRFYAAGYNGSSTIMANIEAGHIWSGHETLDQVTTRVTGMSAAGSDSSHATRVGSAMGGRATGGDPESSTRQSGIAAGAELWSGAIATKLYADGSFDTNAYAVSTTYSQILQSGVDGRTADVFNSSWGFTDPGGSNLLTLGIDGLINDNGTVGVFSAGNEGPASNSVASPGAGYNAITVGALQYPYGTIAGFSSRGPGDVVDPTTGTTLSGVRAAIDITAPGTTLTLATTGGASAYADNQQGTSFAAPLVAGGAALVVDAGNDAYGGNGNATDGRVVKAVLLNAADKNAGWDNGQQEVGGIETTTQSLDWTYGAGIMNLDTSYDQYLDGVHGGQAGTTDLAGLGSGDLGEVAAVGWDFGEVSQYGYNDYFIDQALLGGDWLDATLSWFVDRATGSLFGFSGAQEEHFADLNLSIFRYDNPVDRNITAIVAQSISQYNVVEQLHYLLPESGLYGLRVSYTDDNWDFVGLDAEQYGLAWSAATVPVPVPFTALLIITGLIVLWLLRVRYR